MPVWEAGERFQSLEQRGRKRPPILLRDLVPLAQQLEHRDTRLPRPIIIDRTMTGGQRVDPRGQRTRMISFGKRFIPLDIAGPPRMLVRPLGKPFWRTPLSRWC